jgi:hypothetical protein
MKTIRIFGAVTAAGLATLLSGCVVAPIGQPVAVYPAQPVYATPGAVVVVPAPGYYRYPGYRGHGRWRY